MSEKLFHDDCFITKYKRLRGLVPGISCDIVPPAQRNSWSRPATTNVDYFSFRLTESQLYECWKIIHREASLKDVKMLNDLQVEDNMYNKVEDLMLLIPSTSSKRLENSAWRAWAKTRFQLKELNPAELNWFKENDITWLYGPLIMSDDEREEEMQRKELEQSRNRPAMMKSNASSESLSSMSSSESVCSADTVSTSISSEDLVHFPSKHSATKPILKTHRQSFDLYTRRRSFDDSMSKSVLNMNTSSMLCLPKKKRVSFSPVMDKREIIGDEVFDYNLQFIDNERVGFGYYNLC